MSNVTEAHVGQFGPRIEITFVNSAGAAIDISAASVAKEISLQKPDKSVSVKTASFVTDGTDGKIDYTLADGDLDVAGLWRVQGRVEGPAFEYSSRVIDFRVNPNVPIP